MKTIFLQNVDGVEVGAIVNAIALSDKEDYNLVRLDIAALKHHRRELVGGAIPIGSVEFCREAMNVLGIRERIIDSYPLMGWEPYYRVISKLPVSVVLSCIDKCFVKPVRLKRFNGFIYDKNIPVMGLDEHDKEQMKVLLSIPDTEQVYISDLVDFICEYRYYVDGGIVGYARYDGGNNDVVPDITIVQDFVDRLDRPYPYVLDFGVLVDGKTAIVGYGEFYGIRLYGDVIGSLKYLEMSIKYWEYMKNEF